MGTKYFKIIIIVLFMLTVLTGSNNFAQKLNNNFRRNEKDTTNKSINKTFTEKIIEINEQIELKPNDIDLISRLGNLYLESGFVNEAKKFFEKAYELDSENLENTINMVKVNFLAGNFDLTEMLLLQAEISHPNSFEVFNNLGQVYLVSGQIKKSEEYFRKAEVIDSTNYDVLNSLGFLFQNTGRLELAKEYWYKLIDLYPDDELAFINLGILHGANNEINDALIHFNKAMQKNSNNKEIYYNLGIIYLNNNLLDEAQYNFEKVIQIDENSFNAYYAIIVLHTNQNKYQEAMKVANKLSVRKYNYPQLHLALSLIHYLKENYQEAIRQAQIEISLFPDRPEALILLGGLYREIGDRENESKIGTEIKKKFNISLDDIGDIGTGLLSNKLR